MDIDLTRYIGGEDFYETYPMFKTSFKRKSDIMWGIAFMYHPSSIYYNLTYTDRLAAVQGTISKNYKEDEDLENDIALFKNITLTKSKRFLQEWEIKLEERSNFIASIPYTAETYELLDKMMGNTSKIWDQYRKCLKDVEADVESQIMGSGIESLLDAGTI